MTDVRVRPSRRQPDGTVQRFLLARSRRDSGVVLALTALLMLPLVAATGFAVDVGAWYSHAERIQQAADASALAAVVWVEDDDILKYRNVGLDTARRNGFDNADPDVTVVVDKINQSQVRVVITDNATQYFSQVVMDSFAITRQAVAEFVLPVPLGSPRNFLGTGRLGYSGTLSNIYYPESLTMSINGLCTSKNQGDRKAAQRISSENCTGTTNTEFTDTNYEYYIDLPPNRTTYVDVLIFDGSYITRRGCSLSENDCRDDNDGTLYEANELPPPADFAADFNPGGGTQGAFTTTFTLHQADNTPLDDNDNPSMASLNACANATHGVSGAAISPKPTGTKAFAPGSKSGMTNTGFFPTGTGVAFRNVAVGWWNLCRIPTTAPAGRYVLRVDHGNNNRNGSNNYAIVARTGTNGLCDSRFTVQCAKVYSKDFMSVRGNSSAAVAQFFLAEVIDDHAGKRLNIELWDPAEGGQTLRVMQPCGTNNWCYVNFNWYASDGTSGNNTSSINVAANNFDGDLVTIQYDLPVDYSPPADNKWWKIEYTYASGTVTDRTTWAVNVTGDPVHLVD